LRVGGPGALNSIWAEDGRYFLSDALTLGAREAVTNSINGYFLIGPRLLAEVASKFPVEYAAPVLTIEAALIAAILGLIVYVASAAYLRQPALRLLVSVPAVITPVAVNIVDNNVATLQFPLLYTMFWALLWRPSTRWGQVVGVGVIVFGSLTTPLGIALIPLALLRFAVICEKIYGTLLLVGLSAGVAMQFVPLSLGWTTRGVTTPRYDVPWVLGDFVTKAVPQAIFGETWMGGGDWLTFPEWTRGGHYADTSVNPFWHLSLIVAAWLIVGALVVMALRRAKPNWSLAALAFAYSAGIFALQGMTSGGTPARYLVVPVLLLLTAAAALLDGSERLPQLAFLALIAVVCVANFRAESFRTYTTPWTQIVQEARDKCADPQVAEVVLLTGMPQLLWDVKVPCYKVR
jgi:hypothetical protein